MKRYELIDLSGDAGIRIHGMTLEELFANAARGMYELVTDTSIISESERREISLEGDTLDGLLVLWLNELIFQFDTYGFIGRNFSFSFLDTALTACVAGGLFDPDLHEQRLLIKAATYHKLYLKKNSIWEARVMFDI